MQNKGKVQTRFRRPCRVRWAAWGISAVGAIGAIASTLAFAPSIAVAQVRIEAYAGEPWGVGQITFPAGEGTAFPFGNERFTVAAPNGRILYPVVRDAPVRRVLRQLLEIDRTPSATVLFLFRGSDPLEVHAVSPRRQMQTVRPRVDARAHGRLLNQWWEQTTRRWQQLLEDPEFPPVVENFVAASMARRFGLPLPESRTRLLSFDDERGDLLGELIASESARLALDREILSGKSPGDGDAPRAGGEPLPAPMPWFNLPQPDKAQEIEVEPMAAHIPAECFYLRFGNFSNYLWFRDLSKKWQGDLMNMVQRRSVDRRSNERLQQQLSLRESALAKILGPQVIADVALIGLDPFLGDGAAIGIVFQAHNDALLYRDLTAQRREALARFPDAVESSVSVAGREVSLIATPGGEVRSYYVRHEQWHLAATSPQLVRRFLQAAQGAETLAASPGFLHARQRLPLSRGDALFAYVPPEFFKSLTSPAVWIESQRRLRSLREMALLELARRQASAEGIDAHAPAQLIAHGLLPENFSRRADGSELLFDEQGPRDSLRGKPGRLLPIADVETASCTPEEAAAYRRFADRFRLELGQIPPLALGAQRGPGRDETSESMRLEFVAPMLEGVKLGKIAQALGPPSDERTSLASEDLIRVEVVLESLLPLLSGGQELHHLFGALLDGAVPLQVAHGKLNLGGWREHLRGYIGAWPRPGLLANLSVAIPPDADQPIDPGGDVWGQRRDDMLVVSLRPEIVRNTLPQLQRVAAERPAQAWIDVRRLAGTQLAPLGNALAYERSRAACRASLSVMDSLQSQLHVPAEACREVAELLLDGALTCPLGGEYQLMEIDDGQRVWSSTGLTNENRFFLTQTPADYQAPLFTWFLGLQGDLALTDNELSARIYLEMDRQASQGGRTTPIPEELAAPNPDPALVFPAAPDPNPASPSAPDSASAPDTKSTP